MNPVETVNYAFAIAQQRSRENPSVEMFASILRQLEYMSRVLTGEDPDRSRMKDIVVGHYAARELDGSDPELAEALYRVQVIASKMARGLQVM
jgi:hypothetical protein